MTEKHGDLLTLKEGVLVHGCNTLGLMGAGFARELNKKYPEACRPYFDICANHRADHRRLLGKFVAGQSGDLIIVHAFTQEKLKSVFEPVAVSYNAIEKSFKGIDELCTHGLALNIPKIGAGLAGGNWNIIKTIIEETVKNREVILWTID